MPDEISRAIHFGRLYEVEDILNERLTAGAEPRACLDAMTRGLETAGNSFEAGEYFVPELMMAAETFKAGLRVLEPLLKGTPREFKGTIALGTVKGDIHNIGKNIVGFMLEGAGFKVMDLGEDVSPQRFVEAVRESSPDVLGLSALLTTTMLGMKDVIEALNEAGLRDKVRVILGGAPVSGRFAESVGADAYAPDAGSGVREIEALIERRKRAARQPETQR